MSWFGMDDKFHSHLKVITAGNAAVGLFARAGCWCSDHCSDGLIPTPVAAMLGKPKEIEALLAAWLWAKVDGGYVMPDFHSHVEAMRRHSLSASVREAVILRDGLVCGLCGEIVEDRNGVDIDHIIPVARGGRDHLANLQVTHSRCNRRKGARV